MPGNRYRRTVEGLLAEADVKIGGGRPWDLQVHRPDYFARVVSEGSLGMGESYMDGWWDCDRLDQFFERALRAELDRRVITLSDWVAMVWARIFNLQRLSCAFRTGRHHYDLGNDLFCVMLGPTMVYSGAYWNDARTLDEAQEAKLDLVCRKLGLEPGMRVLDVGCGWGGAARFAASCYGVEVLGITVSQEQLRFAEQFCRGLSVEVRLQDYRMLDGEAGFDRILSLGMFEHVGCKNYRVFMQSVRRRLNPGGLFVLQTIGTNVTTSSGDRWITRYIFPNSMLPSARQITRSIEGLFVLEDWHVLGTDYDRTLMAWFDNFQSHWCDLQNKYGDRFYRMWKYYLLSCAGVFRARKIQLWQLVLSPDGVPGGYRVRR
jgi:cyclopropane-fatty-acyl-phospholipid synthase